MSYPNDFLENMEIVFKNEGIYSNDPDDPGGETIVGIARNYHPNWEGWQYVDSLREQGVDLYSLTREDIESMPDLYFEILNFYYTEFWLKLHLNELDGNIKTSLFDAAINMGIKRAIQILQRALNVTDDGIIGPITLGKAKETDPELLSCKFKLERVRYYTNLCYKKPVFKKYLLGWVNRAINT